MDIIVLRRRFIQSGLAIRLLVVWMIVSIPCSGCTKANEKGTQLMNNANTINNWESDKVAVLSTNSKGTVEVAAKSLKFEFADGQRMVKPLVTFVVPDSSAQWIGPKQDYYLANGDSVFGITNNHGRFVSDGSEPIVGTLQDHSANKIRIRRSSDGKELELDVNQLSKPDQAFIEVLGSN